MQLVKKNDRNFNSNPSFMHDGCQSLQRIVRSDELKSRAKLDFEKNYFGNGCRELLFACWNLHGLQNMKKEIA